MKAVWILECEKTSRQGTAFMLPGGRLITCAHVLGTQTKAFQPPALHQKYPVRVEAKNEDLDVAVLSIEVTHPRQLYVAHPEEVVAGQSLSLLGFPNYNLGDGGTNVPGVVTGFRMVRGVKRFLVSMAIVASGVMLRGSTTWVKM